MSMLEAAARTAHKRQGPHPHAQSTVTTDAWTSLSNFGLSPHRRPERTLMSGKIVTVFGGAGFLGRHVVRALCRKGWRVRVAMRRPHLGGDVKLAGDVGQVQLVQANVRNRPSIKRALEHADAVVNLVGVLYERGAQSFQGTQALGADNIAQLAAEAGIKTCVYVSAIGA